MPIDVIYGAGDSMGYNKYNGSIRDIYNEYLRGKDAIICKGTALKVAGYSNTWGVPLEYYYLDRPVSENTEYLHGYKINSVDRLETVDRNGMTITSIEQSICDMLMDAEYDEQTIIEAIADILTGIENRGIDKLINKAKQAGLSDKIDRYIKDAEDYYSY